VHNLRRLDWHHINAAPHDWAVEFDDLVKKSLDNRQFDALVDYQRHGTLAQMAIPTNDHYLPMLYTLGLADRKDSLRYLFEGFQYGSISMRCFLFE
jgi:4,5-DOPA dioxygenase extradiol